MSQGHKVAWDSRVQILLNAEAITRKVITISQGASHVDIAVYLLLRASGVAKIQELWRLGHHPRKPTNRGKPCSPCRM